MKKPLSLLQIIALLVIFGVLFSALYSAWQTHQRQRDALRATLQNDQEVLLAILAGAMAKSLLSNEHDAAQALVDSVANDRRVVRIAVFDNAQARFVDFVHPPRQQAELRTMRKPIEWRGSPLGHVLLDMDTGHMASAVSADFTRFLFTAAVQQALALCLTLLVLNRRFIWLLIANIDKRKEIEAELQHTVMEQQAIFDNALVGIEVARDRVIQRWNRRLEDMMGYAHGEMVGQSTRAIFPSDESYEALGKIVYEDLAAGRSSVGEWEMMRKDGSLIWCSYHGSPIDPLDPSKGAIWAVQDVTERRRTEAALKQAMQEQQIIFDNANVGINLVRDQVMHRCNRGLELMLGYRPGELAGQSTRIFFASDQAFHAFGQLADEAIDAGTSWIHEWQALCKDGSLLWLSSHVSAVDPQDPSQGAIWVSEDISERKRAEAMEVEAKQGLVRGLAVVEQTYREATLLNELSSYLQACQSAQEAYAAIGEYGPRLFPDGAGAIYLMDELRENLSERASWGGAGFPGHSFAASACHALSHAQTYRVDQPHDAVRCAHVHCQQGQPYPYACLPLAAQNATFGLLFVEHRSAADEGKIEQRHQLAVALAEQAGLALANLHLRETLRQQSIRDPLTGLYNRRYMNETIRHELAWAQRKSSNLAIAILDVDHFKQFNDRFGHDAGDYVLQGVARALEERVRQSDVVCRFGGEEFVVLLPGISHTLALERAGDLLSAVRGLELQHGNRALGRITVSLGLAFFPIHGNTPETLIEAADAALYQAKAAGRNQVVLSGT